MALNDRERLVLAEIARQVQAEDPDFAAVLTVYDTDQNSTGRRSGCPGG